MRNPRSAPKGIPHEGDCTCIARRIRRRAPTGGFEAVGRVGAPPRGPGPALGRF